MSNVTNLIFCCSITDGNAGKVTELNQLIKADELLPLLLIQKSGGDKMLEACISTGAYNHLNVANFTALIESIAWHNPKQVQLFALFDSNDFPSVFIPIPLSLKEIPDAFSIRLPRRFPVKIVE